MPVSLSIDPVNDIGKVIEHHFPSPEAKASFDAEMTKLNALEKTGRLGNTPEEKFARIQQYFKQAYPQLLPGDFNPPGMANTPERDAYVADYKKTHGPIIQNLPQFLADRGIMEQPKGVGAQLVYPAGMAVADTAGAFTGGLAGSAVGGVPGGIAGAGAGAGLAHAAADPLLRYATGMPQQDLGDLALESGKVALGNGVVDMLVRGTGSVVNAGKRFLLFGGFTPPEPTPEVQRMLSELQRSGALGGTDSFAGTLPGLAGMAPATNAPLPSGGMITRANAKPGQYATQNFGTWFQEFWNNALLGSQAVSKKIFNINQAENRLMTDAVQRLGQAGALTDARIAVETLTDIAKNNRAFAHNVGGAVYQAVEGLPGYGNTLNVSPLVIRLQNNASRLDMAEMFGKVSGRVEAAELDQARQQFWDYFTKRVPLQYHTPPGSNVIYDPPPGIGNITSQANIPRRSMGTFQGMTPGGDFLVELQGPSGLITLPFHPAEMAAFQQIVPETNYARLHEARSMLLSYARNMQARQLTPGDAFAIQAADAGHSAKLITDEMERQVSIGHFPRNTLLAGQYADRLYQQISETFGHKIAAQILTRLEADPGQLAAELLQPHNAEALKYIQKAAESTPDVLWPNPGVTNAEYQAALTSPVFKQIAYKKNMGFMDAVLRPQLQAELIRQSLENESATAFTHALEQGQAYGDLAEPLRSQALTAPLKNPENFTTINAARLVKTLEENALDPATRDAIWGSKAAWEHWHTIASLMERFDARSMQPRAGIGSFVAVAKQSAGLWFTTKGLTEWARAETQDERNSAAFTALGGALMFVTPIVLAHYINNPVKYRELVTALKQTKPNFAKSRIVAEITANSLQEFQREANRHYERQFPTLPGESR